LSRTSSDTGKSCRSRYVRYLLDTAVTRQYEPFKRGFFTVCGGNALPLFRPEEIELLIRGSDEPLDVAALRAVAAYEHWPSQWLQYRTTEPDDGARADEPEIATWFWRTFANTDPKSQRQLLTFITGSDRIPAMGAASVVIKVSLLTADYRRYPVARTCFNQLGLHVYRNPKELEDRLWGAVGESEGFGLK
jgi:E3 ubiquitin-protein ligase HECTD2